MEKTSQKRKPAALRWAAVLACVALLLAAAGWFVVTQINQFTLEIVLLGEEDILLEYGDVYQEEGTAVSLYSSLFWEGPREVPKAVITVDNALPQGETGRFVMTYQARYRGLTAQTQRTVRVVDTEPPVITLVENTGYMVKPGNIYEEPGYSAYDNCDGDITDRVICIQEEELITYSVTDRSGNPAVAKRVVPDYDPVPPQLILTGGERVTLTTGTPYVEQGCTAVDHDGTDLTDRVTVEGEVNWLQPGIYPIVYTVFDDSGNKTTLARKVTVSAEPRPKVEKPEGKTIYLTFDDGPGPYTDDLLEILDRYGVKATFFLVDSGRYQDMKKIAQHGHSLGIHSVSHSYEEIYSSPEAFFADLRAMQDLICRETGISTTLMRFPGGSSNEISLQYSPGIMTTLTEAVQDAGFQYFDWNVLSGDAGGTTETAQVVENVIAGIGNQQMAMVLQHDIHKYSVDAVEQIIRWGLNNGYQFLPITKNSPGFHQKVLN